jgi:polar amino acid transport system substrate-binding protein
MFKMGRYFVLAVFCFCFIFSQAQARDLKVSLPLLPPMVESKDKGILVDLLKAMAEEYKDGKITWDVFPFARSIDNVEKGRADFHMPLITPKNPGKLQFQFSTEDIYKVLFILVTNKNNKDINPKNLSKYKVETDQGNKSVLDAEIPNITGSPSIESSLQKLDIGRIDAWIFSMGATDKVMKKLALKNLKRWEYEKYDVKAVLPLGEKGKEVDKIFSELVKKLKASGKYQKIMGPMLDQKFDPWQP